MYRTRLPFVIAFNKVDVSSHEFAVEWMADFESFQVLFVTLFLPAAGQSMSCLGRVLSCGMCCVRVAVWVRLQWMLRTLKRAT
jgi:hypothetical protein